MKNYLQIVSSHKKLIFFVILLCGIFSFLFAKFYPTTYTASTLFTINRVNRAPETDFPYDNYYYSIQATGAVGDTVSSLLQSPEVILEIYKKAGLEKEIKDIAADAKRFRPKQISSHLIKLKITTLNKESSEKLAKSTEEVLKNRVKKLETNFENKNSFDLSAEKAIIFTNKYSSLLVTILGLFGGLFLGVGLAFLFEYFKTEKK